MTTRKIDSDSLKGKRVLLAWHPEEDGPELEQLRDQLERAGAAVEIAAGEEQVVFGLLCGAPLPARHRTR